MARAFPSDQFEEVHKVTTLGCVGTVLELFIMTRVTEIYFKTII